MPLTPPQTVICNLYMPDASSAQLELRKQKRWESPRYWAGFVQHGEWQ